MYADIMDKISESEIDLEFNHYILEIKDLLINDDSVTGDNLSFYLHCLLEKLIIIESDLMKKSKEIVYENSKEINVIKN